MFFSCRWWILEPRYLFLSPAICGTSDGRVSQMQDVGPLVLCQDKERPSPWCLHMPKMSATAEQEHDGQTERSEEKRSQFILAFTSIFRPDSNFLFLLHCLCYSHPFRILPIITHRLLCYPSLPHAMYQLCLINTSVNNIYLKTPRIASGIRSSLVPRLFPLRRGEPGNEASFDRQ